MMGLKKITRRVGSKGQHESLLKSYVFTPESTDETKEMVAQFNAENALDFRFAKFEQFFKQKLIEQGLPLEGLSLADKPDDAAVCCEMFALFVEKHNVNARYFSALQAIFLSHRKTIFLSLGGLLQRIAPENKTADNAAKALLNLQSAKLAYEAGNMEIAMKHLLGVVDDMHCCVVADMEPRWHAGKSRSIATTEGMQERSHAIAKMKKYARDKFFVTRQLKSNDKKTYQALADAINSKFKEDKPRKWETVRDWLKGWVASERRKRKEQVKIFG
ncbi:hypothetical protein K4H28_01815 [Deefgea tanakiae]|uniref:Uncharacterized protein n=1 Tax=Deefgea tanakiae TaxID=2865840 RepID=A0ABX8Z6H3_9NEIS|nr:hypothetical protein [Deefgea tanakiae]QZA78187.1 hypothetical protein K4H28_01815 [Deefgea tanakiae]